MRGISSVKGTCTIHVEVVHICSCMFIYALVCSILRICAGIQEHICACSCILASYSGHLSSVLSRFQAIIQPYRL